MPEQHSRWNPRQAFIKVDKFGREIPAFNFNGESKVKSFLGGFVTVSLIAILVIFAADNLLDLINREFPIVQDIKIKDYITSDNVLNLKDVGYHFAFTFENRKQVRLDDPRFIKILVRYR